MKRTAVRVPATAPSGARSRKPSSSRATTPSSPDRSRKPSSATHAGDEQNSFRGTSGWTTRPSLIGVMAAQRFGMGLLRKTRASNTTSKRGSTIGEKQEPPPPLLEPTYRLESKEPFKSNKVEELIQTTLDDLLNGKTYRPSLATVLCRRLSDELREKVKKLGYDRYRFVVNVVLGEKKDQGLMATSRCAWDDKRDSFASYTYQAPDFFCTANVYGVYKE